MLAFLLLGHAAIACALLPARALPERLRARFVVAGAILGFILGAALVALHDSGEEWRTTVLADPAAIAGAAAAGAWLLVAGLDLGSRRWAAAGFTGVAATSLGLFAANRWIVPALLFWAAGSLALTCLIVRATPCRARTLPVAVVLVSDALVGAALLVRALGDDLWDVPVPVRGWTFWLVAAAALVRAGSAPGVGIWGLLGHEAAPALPLLVGGGAVLAGGLGGRPAPWLAAALVAISASIAGAAALRRVGVATLWAGPVALGLGTIYVTGDAAVAGGIAIVVGAVAAGLWSDCGGRAWVERGLALSFVPTTIGFSAVAVAAGAAFFRTDLAESAWDKAPWLAVLALLPVALAAALSAAARIGRAKPADAYFPAVVALWIALVAAIALGVKASTTGELGAPIDKEFALYGTAIAAALVVGLGMRLRKQTRAYASVDSPMFEIAARDAPEALARPAAVALWGVAFAIFAGLAVVTLLGLRDGFL